MKQRIRLTESQLHKVIKESVKRVLRESIYDTNDGYVSTATSEFPRLGGCMFRGKPLNIIGENQNELVFEYDGERYSFNKTPCVIDPYGNTWDGVSKGLLWYVSDGRIDMKPTEEYDTNNEEEGEYYFQPNDKVKMPTAKEIFSNERVLEQALAYRMEYEDYNWYDNIFSDLSLEDIVEVFWVCGGGTLFNI